MRQKGLRDHPGHTVSLDSLSKARTAFAPCMGPLLGAAGNTLRQGQQSRDVTQAERCNQDCPWGGCS